MSAVAWIGVDFDGTLAEYHEGQDIFTLGEPIPDMLFRVKKWVADGKTVKIVTARAASSGSTNDDGVVDNASFALQQVVLIQSWLVKHLGFALEVTACKDFRMTELWDDRAIQVVPNTGKRADGN